MKACLYLIIFFVASNANATPVINETEVGIASAKGNSQTETYNIKQMNSYQVEQNIFRIHARYLNTFTDDKESSRFISLSLRYERELEAKLSVYAGQGLEKDRFAGYHSRIYSDLGGKYYLVNALKSTVSLEAGFRYLTEERVNSTQESSSYARGLLSYEKKPDENLSFLWWAEYVPNLSSSKKYFFNSEISLSFVLGSMISLKSAYLVRYNNDPLPCVAFKADKLLTTSIVAKF